MLHAARVVFCQSRSGENDLPDEVPAWFLHLSNAEAPGPVAFTVTVPRTDFVVVPESVAVQNSASRHVSQELDCVM